MAYQFVSSFRDEMFFCSNMFPCQINLGLFSKRICYPGTNPDEDFVYRSSEHVFQSMRAINYEDWFSMANAQTPFKSKKLSKELRCRPDWEKVSLAVMCCAVYFKFSQNVHLANLLKATGNTHLVEENNWNDVFWGVNIKTSEGFNFLGKILMIVRKEIFANYFDHNVQSRLMFDNFVLEKIIHQIYILKKETENQKS